jgi:hypothetical protein
MRHVHQSCDAAAISKAVVLRLDASAIKLNLAGSFFLCARRSQWRGALATHQFGNLLRLSQWLNAKVYARRTCSVRAEKKCEGHLRARASEAGMQTTELWQHGIDALARSRLALPGAVGSLTRN